LKLKVFVISIIKTIILNTMEQIIPVTEEIRRVFSEDVAFWKGILVDLMDLKSEPDEVVDDVLDQFCPARMPPSWEPDPTNEVEVAAKRYWEGRWFEESTDGEDGAQEVIIDQDGEMWLA